MTDSIRGRTDYAPPTGRHNICRLCGCPISVSNRYHYCNSCKRDGMKARAKVPGQIERLLARKAMWETARADVLAEFSEDRIVGRAMREARDAAD